MGCQQDFGDHPCPQREAKPHVHTAGAEPHVWDTMWCPWGRGTGDIPPLCGAVPLLARLMLQMENVLLNEI